MALFIQTDATGAGAGTVNPNQAAVDLMIACNGDTGLGVDAVVSDRQQVTYIRTLSGVPPTRIDTLVNTAFVPDYGGGAQAVNIIVLPVGSNFVLNDGSSILNIGGTSLPPTGSGLAGAGLNLTSDCLVIYDTTQNNSQGYCTARAGSGGTLDLPTPNSIILYHELSHAFRIVTNAQLALTAGCDPSSPEENAAITDENDLRTQVAVAAGTAPTLRDPGNHCGAICGGPTPPNCCIIASVASGSPISPEVQALRALRDGILRRSQAGFAFFQQFFRDYYAFSPQICTLMAAQPALRERVLESFVRPLIAILRIMQHSVVEQWDDDRLGEALGQAAGSRDEAETTLARLGEAQLLWRGETEGTGPVERAVLDRMLTLLSAHAWPSDHINWGLIEPLTLFANAIEQQLAGVPAAAIGRRLHAAFDAWGADMPIDHIWAVLSRDEVDAELAAMERLLLHSESARARFRERLVARFGDLPAIARFGTMGSSAPPTVGKTS